MHYSPKIAALIPSFNDDYSLYLCIQSVAPFFDEVWINDDGSTDKTDEVIRWALTTYKNLNAHKMTTQTGFLNSVNTLFSLTDAQYVFKIDADDIMYSNAVNEIKIMIDTKCGCFMFGLQECWGDFHHSRRGLSINWDPVHLFIDREICDVFWYLGDPPDYYLFASTSTNILKWPKRLFFHTPGVKSDERCVQRTLMVEWEMAGKPCPLPEWQPYKGLSTQVIHEKALRWLLFDVSIKRKLTPIPLELIPEICLENERFELIKDTQGFYTDRVDYGWFLDPCRI
jgi:glycosyltransferase involved in cell wall biosynthesis